MAKNDQPNMRSCISLENKKGIEIEKSQCSQSMRESMEQQMFQVKQVKMKLGPKIPCSTKRTEKSQKQKFGNIQLVPKKGDRMLNHHDLYINN